MGWSKKKADPISERARALTEEIAALEAQIKRLDSKLGSAPPAPRLRSTALPHGAPTVVHPSPPAATAPDEPIFEEVNQNRLKARSEPDATPDHFNDLGVRKYDLAAFLQRIKNHFRGPPTMNPKLVNYLAAGSIQGLRPMRYEKRVARNRVLALVIVILLVLLGLWAILPHH
ncbi:MAG TPA: hypothetical protein VN048_08310 [Verrucomicrobiae bacterium]|jgi:hypothetical protein|nr:hypothetical protein [Verrucomicrobiae bacterium]